MIEILEKHEHFYNQKGRDDVKLGSEQWFPLFLLCEEIQFLIKWSQFKS